MKYDTFIFDLDGTLVSHEMNFSYLREELERIIVSYGYNAKGMIWEAGLIDTLKHIRTDMKKMGLDGDRAIGDAKKRIYDYEMERAPFSSLIPGTIDVLKHLRSKGCKIAIVTRNNRQSAEISVKNAGISEYVDLLIARGDTPTMKPDPAQFIHVLELLGSNADSTVVVGDYVHEIEAGNALGCYTIGVLTGTGDTESLRIADVVVYSLKDIIKLFK